MSSKARAVVLVSGGLDSTTALAWARRIGLKPVGLAFRYGQRHARELQSARKVCRALKVPIYEIELKLPWLKGSSLVNKGLKLPDVALSKIGRGPIPSTYVPGRNIVFLALAASLADSIGAGNLVIGSNALDYSGYPDCRPEFNRALERAVTLGTRLGAQGRRLKILAPLSKLDKAGIVRLD